MQQPFKHIANAKRFIEKMSADLDNIKNPKVKDFQIDALNSFIMVINSFESFLSNSYELKAVEGLLCGRLYSMAINSIVDGEGFDIKEVVRRVDENIKYPEAVKEGLVLMLNAENVSKSVEFNGVLPKEGYEDWLLLVNDLLNQFKQQMVWS